MIRIVSDCNLPRERCRSALLALALLLPWPSALASDGEVALALRNDGGVVSISGHASSEGHAAILRDVAASLYPDAGHEVALTVSASAPPGWSLLTEQALRSLAALETGRALVSETRVEVYGRHADATRWQAARRAMERALLDDMLLVDRTSGTIDTADLSADAQFEARCRQQFDAALQGRRVDFGFADSRLSPASLPLLDTLVEIAADCPAADIVVTGHTDASGDESYNLSLSAARARAVAEYLASRGIAEDRLTAIGAGASVPVASNETSAGRARNRRIAFEFRFRR